MITRVPSLHNELVRDNFVGRAIVFPEDNVNTDRILPSRYLKELDFAKLGAHAFAGDRANAVASGQTHPFDAPENRGAVILIAGKNFGAGSSREAAPRALHSWGIGAIVAASFGEIFRGNASAIGLPCVTIDPPVLDAIRVRMDHGSGVDDVALSLSERRLALPDCGYEVGIAEAQRRMFLTGAWDTLALLMQSASERDAVAARLPYLHGFRR